MEKIQHLSLIRASGKLELRIFALILHFPGTLILFLHPGLIIKWYVSLDYVLVYFVEVFHLVNCKLNALYGVGKFHELGRVCFTYGGCNYKFWNF